MANEFKTLPIGTIFTYNGNKYKVCKDIYNNNNSNCCDDCAFHDYECGNNELKQIRGECYHFKRIDKNEVYYKRINDETMNKDSNNSSIITPTLNTDNSLNDLHIECPKGYSIDVEHSDLYKGIIKFKKSNITYKDIEDTLNLEKDLTGVACNVNNVDKLNAIDKLINIANYYNKGWKPDWNNSEECKCCIVFSNNNDNENNYSITYRFETNYGSILFRNKEDAQSVIDNPNFRDILDSIYKD